MSRGESVPVGTETIAQNGYINVKTEDGWIFKHHLIAEQNLGRKLRADERVYFVDGDRHNYAPDNIEVRHSKAKAEKIRWLEQKVEKMEKELTGIKEILSSLSDGIPSSSSSLLESNSEVPSS